MSWANPNALWLLAAILLLVFARRRKPQRRLAVANLYLWNAATTRDAPSLTRRFRRSLLLLLQAAFMAALIVAIARPLFSFGGGRVALIVDVSMSMGARDQSSTRLDAAKARAVELAEALPRRSRVRLWVASATVDDRGEFGSRDAALRSAIQSLQITDAGTDVESAVVQARLADSPPSHIYFVTDRPGAAADDVEWARIGEASENVALTRLTARRRSADQSIELLIAAANYGAQAASFDAVVSQNDSILARRAMQLPPRGESTVVMTLPNTAGVVLARLESRDALTADDSRIIAIPPADPLRVRLINGSYFIERALTAHPGTLVVQSTPNGGAENADNDVIVCDGCADVPASAGSVGVLLLAPRSAAAREAAPVTVNINARAHPVVGLLSLDSVLVSPVQSVPSHSPDGSRSGPASIDDNRVIAHAAGAPVIVAHEDGLRRVVELRFDPAAGFALDPAFPMLIANCLDWLAAPRRSAVTVTAGDLLQLKSAVITGPDGHTVPVSERAGTFIAQTERAGVYRITQDAETKTLIVNPRVEGESDLSAKAETVQSSAVAPPAMTSGWDATGPLLLLALALLAMEWRLKTTDRGLTP